MKRESRSAIVTFLLAIFCLQTFAAPVAPPQKPNFARVSAISPFEIDLNWRDRANDEGGFQIERSTDRTHFRQIAQVLPGTTTYRDKNLFPGTKYFYRIRAFNTSGTSRYDTTSARTQTPVVPLSVADWGYPADIFSPTNSDIVSVSAGSYHDLGLKKDGTVIAWGFDITGQTMVPTNLTGVVAISAGTYHSLALKSDGTVVAWGDSGIATPPDGLNGVVAIAAGYRHSLALKNDGTVVCWGLDDGGDLTPPAGLSGVVEIAVGDGHSLALKSDGTVVQWGNLEPPPTNLTSVVGITAGSALSVAVKNNGSFVAWGSQAFSTMLAISNVTSDLTDIAAISVGSSQGLALRKDHTIFSWSFGYPTFTAPELSNSVVAICAKGSHQVVLSLAPAVPSNPSLTVLSANQLQLSWQDNSTDEKSFTIQRASYSDTATTPWAQIATVNANVTNFTDTTVQVGTTYVYRLRAIGKFGASPYSSEAIAMLAPPPVMEDLTATIGSTNGVNLAWYGPFNEINSFKIERAPDENGVPGDWVEIASVPTSTFPQSFTDSTVQANTTYWYRVRAFNFFGVSDYSDPVSISIAPPPAPQSLYGGTFADTIQLTWFDNSTASGFKLERAPDVNGNPGTWTQIALLNTGNDSQYTDTGLSLNATYWYRMRAFSWVGDSPYTDPISVTIVPPAPPTFVFANIGLINGVDITWYPDINDEDGFKLERAPDAGGAPGVWSEIASFNDVHAFQESFHDANVVAFNTYWYRVRAFNLFGLSGYSTPISISLLPPPAPTLSAATSLADTVNLQWQTTTPNLLAFKIERAPDADGVPGAWTQIANLSNIPGTYSAYTDTNLTGGALYWYRMQSSNWIGDSPYSDLTVVTIDPPAAPEIYLAILNLTNGVNLGLRANTGDENGYLIERTVPSNLGFMDWTQIATVNSAGATTVGFTDTNAVPNATNWYRVRTFNTVGVSDYSAATAVQVTPPTPPYINTSARSGSVILTIYPNDTTTEAVLGVRLQRAPDAGNHPGAWTTIATINGNSASYTYEDPGLATNTIYWYRAQAFNWVGDSDFGNPYDVMLMPPMQPIWLNWTLTFISHQADLSWYDNASDEDGFTIERAPDEAGAPGVWSQIGTVYATNSFSASLSDTNVVAYTTNWYRVRAFSGPYVSDYATPVELPIIPPPAPYFEAHAFGNQVKLSWDGSAEDIRGYKLERAPDLGGAPGAWTPLTNTTALEYTDKNLAADTTYWYRVHSYNWVGDGDYTDPINVTIMPPAQPSNLFAGLGTNTNTVVLQWSDFDHDEDGFKIERVGGFPGDDWQEIGSINASHADHASFVDTNVTAYTTNWYRVRAFSTTGLSDYAAYREVNVVPPDPPFETTATPYLKSIQFSWFENFGIGIGGFVVQRAPDAGGSPGTWIDLATNAVSAMSYNDENLPGGATYWYRVRSFNWVGFSDFSSTVSATALGIVMPGKPNTPSGYPTLTNQIFLSWVDPANDEDGFKIQRALDVGGAPGNWTEIGTIYTTNFYLAFFTDTNVMANSTNWYRVQAFNSTGVSEFSDSNSVTVIPPVTAPRMTPASIISTHRIDVRWQADAGFIQGYKIERAPDAGGIPGAWTLLADIPSTDTVGAYSDITVVMNKQYWYRVQSYNWSGNSPYSDPLLVVDAPPLAPAPLTITNDQPHQFTLNWTKPSDDILSFKIERAPDNRGIPGAWIQIADPTNFCGLIPTNYTDIGIPTGQTFWYRVRALNVVGNSPYSNDASATETTQSVSFPTPAQILSLTTINDGILIQWSTTAGNTDVVQASGNFANVYTNISPALVIGGSGDIITNYFEAGALTNSPTRFYRIRSSR